MGEVNMGNLVHFIGAGPGDPDLITVKGRKILSQADVIIYAGSLISKEHFEYCKEGVEIHNSASMTLNEVIEVINNSYGQGKNVVRLHTGDPAIYGAIKEQIDELNKLNIPSEVIPGVSSFTAAAAAIKSEFTLPNVSQTVILTRVEGRTPVPEKEELEKLAAIGASMALFLSVGMIDKVVERLRKGYGRNVPVAVIQRATWQDEKYIIGTLDDIAEKVKKENIIKTAQILVGDFIDSDYNKSLLYDEKFSHMFRKAKDEYIDN
jgi:precorrin-4/cobalt-precorrin-4 C11-methyltransferase